MAEIDYTLHPIGFLQSSLTQREGAPKQGREGAPDAWLTINEDAAEGLHGIAVGDDLIIISWLHQSQRSTLKVHPRGRLDAPLTGVFATRSPDRPNPLGLHRVKVLEVDGTRLKIGPVEAIDGTPVIDIKPVLSHTLDA